MKSKISYLFIVLMILSMLASACTTSTPAPAVQTEAPVKAPVATGPIKIGASLPLTGDFSDPGTAAKKGYEVWADGVNKAGGLLGRQVQLVIVDNASNPDTAVADYEKLITQDKVDLVVGPFSSRLVIPTSEVANKYGYAFVEPAGGAPDVFNRGLTNLFFAQPAPSATQGVPFAKYILSLPEASRPKTFAVVTNDDAFTKGVVESLAQMLKDGGMTEALPEQVYPPDTKDFSSIAAKVADKNPDLIVGGTMLEDSVGQIKAYQQAGYQPRAAFFTTGPSLPKEFNEGLGKATEGVFSSISWFEASTTQTNPEFVKAYHDKFGSEPIAEDSANAFTVGQILEQAVVKVQSLDNAKLIAEIHADTFKTVVGPLAFDEKGQPKGSWMVLQWQGGTYKIIAPDTSKQAEPEYPKPNW